MYKSLGKRAKSGLAFLSVSLRWLPFVSDLHQFPFHLFPASLLGYKIFICHVFSCVDIHPVAAQPVVLGGTYPSALLEDDASISKNCNCSV